MKHSRVGSTYVPANRQNRTFAEPKPEAELMTEPQYVSATKAAELLGITDTAIRKRIKAGSIRAMKHGREWRIPMSEIEPVSEGSDENEPNSEPDRTNPNLVGSIGSESPENPLIDQYQGERDALAQELEVLRMKLVHAEEQHEATRRECEATCRTLGRAESEVDHLRGANTQQGETIRNLTEEIKGLTITLHNEQGQRMQLSENLDNVKEELQSKKRGLFGRMFRRKRIARIGPK